jgi:hypothetical protein
VIRKTCFNMVAPRKPWQARGARSRYVPHIHSSLELKRHHRDLETPAMWLIRRLRVRPALAARLAELAGLGGGR